MFMYSCPPKWTFLNIFIGKMGNGLVSVDVYIWAIINKAWCLQESKRTESLA